jgi:hypothetical protein
MCQALRGVSVNIRDFLDAANKPDDVHRFPSRKALQEYTESTRKYFPLKRIEKGSPLGALLINRL